MSSEQSMSRRTFMRWMMAGVGMMGAGFLSRSREGHDYVWQIDPTKCIQCGKCATACVLTPSAAKCVHVYAICGYCDLCSGNFIKDAATLDTGAENLMCPTGAIKRTFIEEPYFEYTIDESLCIGCARCVKGCSSFGNGSMFMQIRHDLCANCNQCAIALQCPADAFRRVPRRKAYLLKSDELK